MTAIQLRGLAKQFDGHQAVSALDLQIKSGSLFALLGPSGCGKTTLLRMLAGLEQQDSGQIFFDDHDISQVPAEKRRIGMVFQHYALFPHMNVSANVAYGLQTLGMQREAISNKVKEALELVGLQGKEQRSAAALSGGEQQRVALARAIVIKPQVLLFDEPLSNLDARLRIDTRQAIRRLVNTLGITSVFVTHDQEEALSIADEMAVMRDGQILQQGTPRDCYRLPRTPFVGKFLGRANIFKIDDALRQQLQHIKQVQPEHRSLLIRPEHFRLCDAQDALFSGTLQQVEFQGAWQRLHIDGDHYQLEVCLSADHEIPESGTQIYVQADAAQMIVFNDEAS